MKNKLFLKILIVNIILIVIGCAAPGRFSVSNVNDMNSLQSASMVYALPLTVIDINVSAEQTVILTGPYCMYAKKYLGIDDAPLLTQEIWRITEVSVKSHIEADPDYVYLVNNFQYEGFSNEIERLMKDSLILGPESFASQQVFPSFVMPSTNDIAFTDLSVKRNFEVEKDVSVSQVLPDTSHLKLASGRKGVHEKTLEEKAEEAADFLIKLRKRRFKMVSGQNTYMPEGVAMAEALKELNRLENEYVSLFIGKRITNKQCRTFHYVPLPNFELNQQVLFRFSSDVGFLNAMEVKGKPVLLEIKDENKTYALERVKPPFKTSENIIFYRIPDQASMKLVYGDELMKEANLRIYQYGAIMPIIIQPTRKAK
jgi:hypothetical protein